MIGGGPAFLAAPLITSATPAKASSRLAFDAVSANTLDTITVPAGYNWHVVAKWGQPLWSSSKAFDEKTGGTGLSQERAFGDNNDDMFLFSRSDRHVLAVNNEYVNFNTIYRNRELKKYGRRKIRRPVTPDDIRKGKAGHGVTVVELREEDGRWSVVKDSPYNRKITADTPVELSGPARGNPSLKTGRDQSGTTSLGTWNNCGAGRTP